MWSFCCPSKDVQWLQNPWTNCYQNEIEIILDNIVNLKVPCHFVYTSYNFTLEPFTDVELDNFGHKMFLEHSDILTHKN